MLAQFKIALKSTIVYIPLLLILIVCQLVLGQIASVALGEKNPELIIALSNEASGEYAEKYLTALENSESLKIIDVGTDAGKKNVFDAHSVQGLLVIPDTFENSIIEGVHDAVYLYPAPGIGDVSLIKEILATEIMVLRATVMFDEAIKKYPDAIGSKYDKPINEEQITVRYSGPPIDARPLSIPPAFGIPALFLLLAFLHASQVVPGVDNRRMILSGRISLLNGVFASQLALLLIWLVVLCLYTIGMKFFYGISIDTLTFFAMFGLILYSITAGSLIASIGKRNKAVYIFIPLLLLNMTLGGGLWNVGLQSPAFAPIIPVASVVLASSGNYMFTVIVYFMCLVCIFGILFVPKLWKRPSAIY